MCFDRVPFGNKSSPFQLNVTLKHHLPTLPYKRVIKELQDNWYVDDCLTVTDSESEDVTVRIICGQVENKQKKVLDTIYMEI